MKDLTKLPQWAQKHIEQLTRQHDAAVEAMRSMEGKLEANKDEKYIIYSEDLVPIGGGGISEVKRYYDRWHKVHFEWDKNHITVGFNSNGDLSLWSPWRTIVVKPMSGNMIQVEQGR